MSRFFRCITGLSLFNRVGDFERRLSAIEDNSKAFHKAVTKIGDKLND